MLAPVADSLVLYLVRRLLLAIPVLVLISFVTYILLGAWLTPLWRFGGGAGCFSEPIERPCTPTVKAVIDEFHVGDPLVQRWWFWVKGLFTGQSGHPIIPNWRFHSIWPELWSATVHTAVLLIAALVVVMVFSVAIGTFAARRPGRPGDVAVRAFAYSAWSLPAFLLALLLQQLFARLALAYDFRPLYFSGIPGAEAGTGFHFLLEWLRHLVLPVMALAAGFVGAYSRYVRSAMLVSLNAPYATTARAKGVTEWRLTVRHALRNSLGPFVNVVALDFGAIFGASLAVDYVLDQRGLASYLVKGLFDSDPNEVQPVILVAAGVVILSRAIADVVTSRLDPRAQLA